MCKIDWHLLFEGVAALGTVSVAIIAIWGDTIKYYFNPPKLRIEFEYEQLIGKYDNIEKSFTYFLKVVNKRSGSAPAKNCKIILSEIQEKIDGKFVSVPIKGTLYFIWSPKDSNPINYLKDYVIEDYFYFFKAFAERALPELNAYTRDFNGYLKAAETKRYILEIRSENITAKEKTTFEVYWNGSWSEDAEIMKRNLTIKKL